MPEALSGPEAGRLNAEALEAYLKATPKGDLPMSGGRPNASKIAAACGFDRKVLYTNPLCRVQFEALLAAFDCEGIQVKADGAVADQLSGQLQAELSRAHARITALSAENRSLRDMLKRYRGIEDHLLETGRLVR